MTSEIIQDAVSAIIAKRPLAMNGKQTKGYFKWVTVREIATQTQTGDDEAVKGFLSEMKGNGLATSQGKGDWTEWSLTNVPGFVHARHVDFVLKELQ